MGMFDKFRKDNTESSSDDSHNDKDVKRITGKIIKLSEDGWGFITSLDIPFTRIFFHWTSLKQDTLNFTKLEEGMRVEFTPIEVEGKGFRAIKINVIDLDS